MSTFQQFNLSKQLKNAIEDLGFESPTPIQQKAFSKILSGKDIVGISQTGTGKSFAYMLPILHQLKFSKQITPRVLILVPTRELVDQMVSNIKDYTKYLSTRILGVYGESNMNKQKEQLAEGTDILVATPGRLYDLAISKAFQPRDILKLVIDEVDVMLDLGFRPQLTNIFELMPTKKQNIMFSATMTREVDSFIDGFFTIPLRISVAVSGTRLENISQCCYSVKNFHTKVNLLKHLLSDRQKLSKTLVFISSKSLADKLLGLLEEDLGHETCIIHSNKSQNYRVNSVKEFEDEKRRVLLATDVIARGLDLTSVTHVINFDTPVYPENYMHRIGRTGRAQSKGHSILLYTESETQNKQAIEELMDYKIPQVEFPDEVEVSHQLIPEERPKIAESNYNRNMKIRIQTPDEEKKKKNTKTNLGGSYKTNLTKKYKKPKSRGDKNQAKIKKRR